MPFSHNKKRNTGLVYEFLIRRMADQMIEKDKSGYDKTLSLVSSHFNDGSLISDERKLFDILRDAKAGSREHAYRILNEVAKHSREINSEDLDKQKSSLLKEVNYTCGRELFSAYRIPDYRLLATIQLFLDGTRKDNLNENIDRITLEEALIENMIRKEKTPDAQPADDVDQLVCALAGKKFEEKYGKTLSQEQTKLLTKYVRSSLTENTTFLAKYLESERQRVMKVLTDSRHSKEFRDDPEMSVKLNEVITSLAASKDRCDEQFVEDMMLVYGLVREVSSDE